MLIALAIVCVCVCLPSWIWQPGVQCVSFEMELRVLIDDSK